MRTNLVPPKRGDFCTLSGSRKDKNTDRVYVRADLRSKLQIAGTVECTTVRAAGALYPSYGAPRGDGRGMASLSTRAIIVLGLRLINVSI